jgi:hypothetical protein
MHTTAAIIGLLLILNCGFFLIHLVRMEFRMRAILRGDGLSEGVHRPRALLIVPAANIVGLATGAFLVWWATQ